MTAPRVGSLFSGYGGLDAPALALLGPDSHVAWHCDIKPAACTLLAHRDPGVPNLGDIAKIDPASVEPVDALTFGWPCQPHSSAGKRLGEADPRALWPEVARLVAGLRPRYLFGENVARVTSNGELRRVVAALAELGYVGTWRCLRASDVGAPHRRDRLFLFAVDAAADPVGNQLRHEPGWGGRADGSGARVLGHDGPTRAAGIELLPTPPTRNGNGPDNRSVRPEGGGFDLQTVATLLPTPRATDGTNGGPNQRGSSGDPAMPSVAVRTDQWGRYVAAATRWEALTRPAPEPTQVSPRTGKPQLAPAFVEWMMGLPGGWVTEVPGLSRNQQLSLLGDGVVPLQAIAAFTELTARMFHVEHAA